MILAIACKAALRRVFKAGFPKKDEAHIPGNRMQSDVMR